MLKMKIVYGVKRIGAYLCLEQDTKLIILLRFDVLAFFVSTISSSKYMSTYNIVHRVHKETSKYHHIAAE